MIKIRTDNIGCIHNHDLIDKLRCASHPSINDMEAVKLVKEEIKKRQLKNKWDLLSEEDDDEVLSDEELFVDDGSVSDDEIVHNTISNIQTK